jgi:MFS family permease
MPLMDTWAARECIGEAKFHFGTLRMWGSMGYAIIAIIYGRLSMSMDITYMYFGRAIFFIITIFFIYKNQFDGNGLVMPISQMEKKDKPAVRALFAKKEYWLFFIFLFFFCFHVNAANTFFPKLLFEKGSTNQTVALFGSITAILEIPFLLYARRLNRKLGARGLILLGALFSVLRMVGFSFAPSIPLLLAAHLCLAPYVGFFIPGFIYYSHSIAPKHTQAFTLTSLQGLSMSFSGMLGSLIGGVIVDYSGIQSMFAYYSILCILGILMFLATSWWLNRRNLCKNEK